MVNALKVHQYISNKNIIQKSAICVIRVWSVFEFERKVKLKKNQSRNCREDPENDNGPYWVEYEVVFGVHMAAEVA